MKRKILFFPVVLCCCNNLIAQNKFYFSSNSTGKGAGTKTQPFTSFSELANLSLTQGDSVFFEGGKPMGGTIALNNIHGKAKRNIVFTSYGKGRAVIDGGNKEAWVITGSSFFEIVNLELLGAGRKTGNTTDGLKLVDCRHVVIRGMEITGFQKSGLLIYNCQAIAVNGVYAHENGLAGISLDGTYQKRISDGVHFSNCKTDNNPGDPTNLDNHSGNGLVVGNCKNVLIEYCTATNNGWDMPRIGNGPVGIWAWEADSVIIQYCISYRNKTAKGAADGGGFDLDGAVTNSVVQYCLSYENWGTGYGIYQYYGAGKWFNNTVRYCISINDGNITDQAAAMHIWNGWNGDSTFTDCYVYNNFFYNDSKYILSFNPLSRHKRFSFYNNIFVGSDSSNIMNGIDSSTDDAFLANLWTRRNGGFFQDGFTNLEKWADSNGYERYQGEFLGMEAQRSLINLPAKIEIINPYKLRTDPMLLGLCIVDLKNKGMDLRKIFKIKIGKTDFFGHPVPTGNGIEPGVCEIK